MLVAHVSWVQRYLLNGHCLAVCPRDYRTVLCCLSLKFEDMDLLEKYVPGAQAKVKTLVEKAKTYAMSMNMTELEIKVMEATNSEPWGPHGSVMSGTYHPT